MKTDTFSYVPPRIFNRRISIDVGQESETESVVVVVGRVGETVDNNTVVLRMIHLAHSTVEFIVCDTAPVLRLLICHWLSIVRRYGSVGGV